MSSMFSRSAVGAVAVAAALSLAACNSQDGAKVSTGNATPSDQKSSSAPTSSATSESSSSSTSQAPSSSTTSSPSTRSSSSGAVPPAKSGPLTPTGTKLKYGQPATIKSESDGTFRLKVKNVVAAPSSAYAKANLNKSNGNLYYVNFNVTYLGGAKYFSTSGVNFLFLRPVFDTSETGKAGGAPSTKLPGCNSAEYGTLKPGESVSTCYYYQITGPAPTKVGWDDYKTRIIWQK